MTMVRCLRCPVLTPVRCRGLDVRRYCELIDPSCAQFDPGYLEVILAESHRLASALPVMPLAESAALVRRMNACPYRSASKDSGCGCGQCGLRNGASVNHLDCFACLSRFGGDP